MRENPIFGQIFPQGEKLPEEFSAYFIGQAYRAPLVRDEALNCPVSNVTFSPGCRNNWHSHTGGQLLLVTAGRGYYQERGEPARLLLPGDVVEIAPDVEHWHGAAPDSWFAHLAVETNPQTKGVSLRRERSGRVGTDRRRRRAATGCRVRRAAV